MSSKSMKMHELTGKICNSHRRALAYVAATALATTAIAVPATALAEEAPATPTKDDAKQATTNAQQQAPSDSYKVTQTVEKDSKTFDTKDDAQKYLDDAAQKAADMGKADPKSTYDIKTDGPTQVQKDTTHEETSVVDKGSQGGFATQKNAEDWAKDKTSSYKDTDDTKYTTSVTVTPNQTGTKTETTKAASDSKGGFATQKDAEQWVKDQTKGYKDTDDTTYTVHPSYQNNPTTEKDGDPVPGDTKTTTSQEFDSKADAEAALQKDKDADPSTDLHKVSFSNVEETTTVVKPETTETKTYQSDDYMTAKNRDAAMKTMIDQLKADGWKAVDLTKTNKEPSATIGKCFTKIDRSWPEYKIPANTYVIVKQATWYALWTPEPVSDDVTNQIKNLINWGDPSTDGKAFHSGNYGFGTYFQNIGTQGAGSYWVHDNGDGSYTVYASCSKISHLDYGCIQYKPGSYSFKLDLTRTVPAVTKTTYHYTKSVTDCTQPTKTVDHWTASYSVDKTTVTPVYEYVANYQVSQTKTVHDTGWKAGYEITKTTEYAPKPDTPTPDKPTPETPKTPETPAPKTPATSEKTTPATQAAVKATPVAKASVKTAKAKSEAKAALPKTGDYSANTVAAAAAAGIAIAALGLSLRRKGQRN